MSIAVNMNDPTNTGVQNDDRQRIDGPEATLPICQTVSDLTGRAIEERDPTALQNNELTTQLAQIGTV